VGVSVFINWEYEIMHKLLMAIALTVIATATAAAQATDYKKTEGFLGYSNGQVDSGISVDEDLDGEIDDRTTFHGFNVSGVYNFSRYFGAKGDVSGTYNNTRFDFNVPALPPATGNVSFDTNNSLYNFLGGVQIKDNASDSRVKPFAHILAGAGHARVKVKNVFCDPSVLCQDFPGSASDTGLAGAFGGGLDVKLNDSVDIRVIQVDYNPIRFDGATTHNFRFCFGIVF
jgi:opacity protein-like surface antigen